MLLTDQPQPIRLTFRGARYVLLQRPELQAFRGWAARLGVPFRARHVAEAFLRRRGVALAYTASVATDLAMIRAWLPRRISSILDIGCGMAGIDLLLYRHYGGSANLRLLLLDSDDSRLPAYGFGDRQEFYSALSLSRRMLVDNGVPAEAIHLLDVARGGTVPSDPLDLVVSLASWGFHYPVSTYLEEVHAALRPGGRLILDVALGRGQVWQLERRFGNAVNLGPTWGGISHRLCLTKH